MDPVPATGPVLDQILDLTFALWNDGLTRDTYGRHDEAQRRTAWGARHLRRWALMHEGRVVCSMKEYDLELVLDGRRIPTIGVGALFTAPAHRGRGHARHLLEERLRRAADGGAGLALLFSEIGADYYERLGFRAIPPEDLVLEVGGGRGAPGIMIRAADDRDIAAIAAMHAERASRHRLWLARDVDLIRYSLARKRVLAGLLPPGRREVEFFVTEEGGRAVAYLVLTVSGRSWTLEECGDRDPDGARVGAMLQVLAARNPGAQTPRVGAWLPPGFLPPQTRLLSRSPSGQLLMLRALDPSIELSGLTPGDLCYWHADAF